jgi:hypothetical protein
MRVRWWMRSEPGAVPGARAGGHDRAIDASELNAFSYLDLDAARAAAAKGEA